MIRSMLIRVPALYEWVQRRRDESYKKKQDSQGTYAQHGEDVELVRILRELDARGPYLDVGCNHPLRLSNTYLMYTLGWRGLCVDPLPRFAKMYRKWRPDDEFRCTAVAEYSGSVDLFEFEADVLSCIDGALAEKYVARGYRLRGKRPVAVRRLDDLLDEARIEAPLSLLSIDIEGHEVSALRSIDLDRWRPALVCIEALTADGSRNTEALDYLLDHGYKVHSDLGLNVVFCRKPA